MQPLFIFKIHFIFIEKSKPKPASNLEGFMCLGPCKALYHLDLYLSARFSTSDLTFNSGSLAEFMGKGRKIFRIVARLISSTLIDAEIF